LNELWGGSYTPPDVEIELKLNELLRNAHKEVELLQSQKNGIEEELNQSQDAKD